MGIRPFLLVAAGGAAGASVRWGCGVVLPIEHGDFPWPTLVVNVIGSLLIGVAAGRVEQRSYAWATLVTGALGGFTTMSAFAYELDGLIDAGRPLTALVYAALTMLGGYAAVAVGHDALGPRRDRPAAR